MKKLALLVVTLGLLLAPALTQAADTATVTVSATVVGTCKFNSGGSITFTLDPSVGGDVNGTVTQPQFWCTKNASYTITDDDGLNETGANQNRLSNGTGEYIPYSFTYTATGTGNGPANPITMDIASTILSADYLNVSAGVYNDTVTLTVNP